MKLKQTPMPAVILGGLVVAGGILWGTWQLAGVFLGNGDAQTKQDSMCSQAGTNHQVIISSNKVTPAHVNAKRCDTLTIVNRDPVMRIMAFGVHDSHISYDGTSETHLVQNQSFTVTLNKAGTYLFHDHNNEVASGDFTVR